jgi:hypothetical protein
MENQNHGVLEYWGTGVVHIKLLRIQFFYFSVSNTPVLLYSITPI